MTPPNVLVSTWTDGLFAITGDACTHELAGHSVRGLAPDGQGSVLAIVDGRSLQRRAPGGEWSRLATWPSDLACSVVMGDQLYVGTEDASVLRAGCDGKLESLRGFHEVEGRETWFAGTAVIDGRTVGPPLGVRSISATADGAVLLANVHVGGIARSTDGGVTWHPTLPVQSDVHEVRAHPTRPDVVMAAAAVGLCISRDAGATWVVEQEGLHASYCSAVAFVGNSVLVAASDGHFAAEGAIYRRRVDAAAALELLRGPGLPKWLAGIADTGCIAAHDLVVAIADAKGNLYLSTDAGSSWSRRVDGLAPPSGVLLL